VAALLSEGGNMQKTKIEWVRNLDGTQGYTWNPVRGCRHSCPYCYAAKIDKRFGDGSFTPTFHPERLQEPLKVKRPSRIFVGSMADLFGDWRWHDIDDEGNNRMVSCNYIMGYIFDIVVACPQHTFIFLTKNPKGMQGFDFPVNCWCGTSVENQEKADERIPKLLKVNCDTLFTSYEPALGPIDFGHLQFNREVEIDCLNGTHGVIRPHNGINKKLDWLIVGAQTGPGAVKPNPVWTSSAIFQARNAGTPIFVKDNCNWPEVIREFPREVSL